MREAELGVIGGWREVGQAGFGSLDDTARAPIVALLEEALVADNVRAVQVERDPGGLVLVSVWVTEITTAVAALLDQAQADGQRVGVSFAACRAGRGTLEVTPTAGALWLLRGDEAAPAHP